MKIKEMRQLSNEDLNSKIAELKKEILKINAQVATGTQIQNPAQLRQNKRSVAKLLTVLKEKTGGVKSNE